MNSLLTSDLHVCINNTSATPLNEIIQNYFSNFKILAKAEQWSEIISQGKLALNAAKELGRRPDEAKINAQLTSSSFYLGDYPQALVYAKRCHELAEEFTCPSLFLRALYLESAVCRALAPKEEGEVNQQAMFQQAVIISEQALVMCSEWKINDIDLHGKIFFNLGAAHADNPLGHLGKATRYYINALASFKDVDALDDQIRTLIRLGKVYLLQKDYDSSQTAIDKVRRQPLNERLAMHVDYLEAQLKHALRDSENALKIAQASLNRAQILGAKEDENRIRCLIELILKGIN